MLNILQKSYNKKAIKKFNHPDRLKTNAYYLNGFLRKMLGKKFIREEGGVQKKVAMNCTIMPTNLPYAPVSSDVSHISQTPSSKLWTALATISSGG